jgi:hypothetical protein
MLQKSFTNSWKNKSIVKQISKASYVDSCDLTNDRFNFDSKTDLFFKYG